VRTLLLLLLSLSAEVSEHNAESI